jgi:UDP-N-acetylmuramoyl-L-alanyl-D-glutamate--2,6-diaminopimelate ligase
VRFDVATPWGSARVASSVLGGFNASNLLGTLAVLLASGVGLREAVARLARLAPISGRMQTVGGGTRPLIVVDYAHTPDALEKALLTLRELMRAGTRAPSLQRGRRDVAKGGMRTGSTADARLICVFGCGGDRDRGKRPLMGGVAARLSDRVIVTSDNPRGEDPRTIAADIVAGIDRGCELELDRRRAIRSAIGHARRGDVVLVAGKGHENYQEVKGVRRPFSDAALARSALARWTAR